MCPNCQKRTARIRINVPRLGSAAGDPVRILRETRVEGGDDVLQVEFEEPSKARGERLMVYGSWLEGFQIVDARVV